MLANEAISVMPMKIEQIDNTNFSITWSDGKKFMYHLAHLQSLCPCAHCRDEASGKRRDVALKVNPNVRAQFIKGVGGYALQIRFKEGCSNGIYSFSYLYRVGESETWKDGMCVN